MFIEIFHDAFCLLVRRPVTVVIAAIVICHDLDARLNQTVQALL